MILVKKCSLLILCFFVAQVTLNAEGLVINGYVDMYYAIDNDPNAINNRGALNSLNVQKDAFDLNLAMLTLNYTNKNYRAKITLQYGDLANSAWNTLIRPIQEANVGINLTDGLWLDGGDFLTHVGGEAITPKDNLLSTLSLSTQNEPFYQSGLKLTYDATENLQLQLMGLNGYNIFEDNNKNKSLGYFVSYKVNDELNFWFTGIYGNEAFLGLNVPNLTFNQTPKLLNNLVVNFTPSKSLQFKLSIDASSQDISAIDDKTLKTGKSTTLGGFLIGRYNLNDKFSITGRAEFFNTHSEIDKLYISDAIGYTLGTEYKPNANSYLRLETRSLNYKKSEYALNPFTSRLEGIFSFGVFF